MKHDVEQEAALLDVDLAVVGLPVDRGDVLLGLVARAILDAELEASRDEHLAARRASPSAMSRTRSRGRARPRFCVGQLQIRRRLDDLELRLLLDLALQEAVELALDVDVLQTLVADLLGFRDNQEGGEHDLLVSPEGEAWLERQPQADLRPPRSSRGGREQEKHSDRPRGRSTRGADRASKDAPGALSPSCGCRRCRTPRIARSCVGCSCPAAIELERLLVLLERPREVSGRLEGDGEVVVRPRVLRDRPRSPSRSGTPPPARAPCARPPPRTRSAFRPIRTSSGPRSRPSDRESEGGECGVLQSCSNGAHYRKAGASSDCSRRSDLARSATHAECKVRERMKHALGRRAAIAWSREREPDAAEDLARAAGDGRRRGAAFRRATESSRACSARRRAPRRLRGRRTTAGRTDGLRRSSAPACV